MEARASLGPLGFPTLGGALTVPTLGGRWVPRAPRWMGRLLAPREPLGLLTWARYVA